MLDRYPLVNQDDIIRHLLQDRQRLCAVAYSVLTDFPKSEDLFQDLVIKAVHRLDQFTDEEHLRKWSSTAIRNAAIDQVRQSRTRARILSALAYERVEDRKRLADAKHGENHRRDALHLCLERLESSERELLHRRYERGESGEELARSMNLSVDAIYKRLSRLHRQLRTAVEQELASVPDKNPAS